ncbi:MULTISPECIES: YgfZ/GcvT domain-containing protein [Sphingomonas]|uniref:CAF17-like 4Fe-4S cluster assembly/insertion protein YgfZ n=1 Tax=Sphingomonas TaxID=13687 RepID=UPI00082DB669|nr:MULTISPECIES: folate-binding protein YgfZ [Sphingomonas]MBY0301155.1 folate-binding protein YgfZ [Sphingomonas ginsenosidimutans]
MDDTTPGTMLADRALLRLAGDDVRGFLQGLLTNDVAGALPVWAGLLTPQGKALFDMIVWSDGDDILLDVERDQADPLARRLAMYRLRRAITIARDDALAVHWSTVRPDDAADAAPDPRLAALGWRWIAAPGPAAAGWHAHRLSLGVAEGAAELGAGETLWLEANARELNGVSFTKGCYVGQENTARMHHRAKVNRRLFVAPIDDGDTRRRVAYPDRGMMVTLRRVEAPGDAAIPDWLAPHLGSDPAA